MADHGLALIRLFAFWDHLEPRQGHYDWATYDAVFDQAASRGLGVIPTLFAVSPPGWMGISGDGQSIGPLDDPVYWQQARAHVRKLAEHWGQHPALHSWILWNEPTRVVPRSPQALLRWQRWLAKKYGSIEAYNATRYRQFESFDSVTWDFPVGVSGSDFKGYRDRLDSQRFAVDELLGWLADIQADIRSADPIHPIHVNPHNCARNVLIGGQSMWREGELVDFIGCSAHPPWHSDRFPRDRVHQSIGYFSDLARSASTHPDECFWVSELQAGPTTWSSAHPSCPSPVDLTHWLWMSIGSGARAVVYWCFNQRNEGFEAGEWGLLGLDGQPTARLRASAAVSAVLEEHKALFDQSRPPKPDVWILHSEDSERLGPVQGSGEAAQDPRNANAPNDAMAGAWLLCCDLGRQPAILDEDRLLAQGMPPEVTTLLVPSATALRADTMALLQRLAETGATVILDGTPGLMDDQACLATSVTADALAALTGARLHDLQGFEGERQAEQLPAWFMQSSLSPQAGCDTLASWADGTVAMTRMMHGSGSVIWLGTCFFQAAFANPDDQQRRVLLERLLPDSEAPLRLCHPHHRLILRLLSLPEGGRIVILLNRGPAQSVSLVIGEDGVLVPLGDDCPGHAHEAGGTAMLDLEANEVRLMRWTPLA
jgi:beta-galactosidase